MLAVGLSEVALRPLLEDRKDRISIAAINGPSSITLAGDTAVLTELADLLTADNVFNRPLQVEVPYHSPMMEALRDELLLCLANLRPAKPKIPLTPASRASALRASPTTPHTGFAIFGIRCFSPKPFAHYSMMDCVLFSKWAHTRCSLPRSRNASTKPGTTRSQLRPSVETDLKCKV
jgi:Acyl transferase domain